MKGFIKDFPAAAARFLQKKAQRRFMYLCLLGILAFADFLILGLVRRTFVFYSIDTGIPVVEDRMVSQTGSRENVISRYVKEALLGPVSLDSAPLFSKGTRLESLLYRDGVIYADLSESAALAPLNGADVFTGLYTLYGGIRRNFSYVKDVRLFIAGHEAYSEKFREKFVGIADI
ncbi:GerMN domain-containing protein [Treponema primitia]|uniref:GerMN domain-containing protein n=1 Tax=Treponema primitia TaxID=88058 RepID=UPI0002554C85|nr:GerMN domain-containing protein [Treponema primitia]